MSPQNVLASTAEERLFFVGTCKIGPQGQEYLEKRCQICHACSQSVIWTRGPQQWWFFSFCTKNKKNRRQVSRYTHHTQMMWPISLCNHAKNYKLSMSRFWENVKNHNFLTLNSPLSLDYFFFKIQTVCLFYITNPKLHSNFQKLKSNVWDI